MILKETWCIREVERSGWGRAELKTGFKAYAYFFSIRALSQDFPMGEKFAHCSLNLCFLDSNRHLNQQRILLKCGFWSGGSEVRMNACISEFPGDENSEYITTINNHIVVRTTINNKTIFQCNWIATSFPVTKNSKQQKEQHLKKIAHRTFLTI